MLQAREKLRAKLREGIARSGLGAPKASRPLVTQRTSRSPQEQSQVECGSCVAYESLAVVHSTSCSFPGDD